MDEKVALIWWRVSTDDQLEISPETQIQEAKALAEKEGYQVPDEYIVGTDWSCSTMARAKELISRKAVSAVLTYDADRGPSKPVHRLLFRAFCEDYDVVVRCCHGQVPDGEMGEFMEFASAWAKEKQVRRAQQGAKDGLRDRARLRGLPVTGIPPYGYQFRYSDHGGKRVPVALEPDPAIYAVACQIRRMALEGNSMRFICRTLEAPPPRGGAAWNPSTIAGMLKNPAYAGVYHALRREMKSPERRKLAHTYGKTASQFLPRESWVPLPDFPVISPIVSWDEWESVQQQLVRNQQESPRNGKRFYLLRGMMFCPNHPRKMSGHGRGQRYWYECPVRRGHDIGASSRCPVVPGARAETLVWEKVSVFLSDPTTFMAELERQRQSSSGQEINTKDKIVNLKKKLADVDRRETDLVNLRLREVVSDEALDRNAALLRAERSHYQDEIEREKTAAATVEQAHAAIYSLVALRDRIVDRLDSASPEERRRVLEALDTTVTVKEDRGLGISVGVYQCADSVHQPHGQ